MQAGHAVTGFLIMKHHEIYCKNNAHSPGDA